MEVPNSIPIVVGVDRVGVFPQEKIPATLKDEIPNPLSFPPSAVCSILLSSRVAICLLSKR